MVFGMLLKIKDLTEHPASYRRSAVLWVPVCMNITSLKLKLFSGNSFPQICVAWATNDLQLKIRRPNWEFADVDACASIRDRASNVPCAS
jgi:hypothetical protein